MVLTPGRPVGPGLEGGGGQHSLGEVRVHVGLVLRVKHGRQSCKGKEQPRDPTCYRDRRDLSQVAEFESLARFSLPWVDLACESPAFSQTAVRNSLTCLSESELCSVSRG